MKIGYVVPTYATSLSNVHVAHLTRLNPDGKTKNTSKVTIDLYSVLTMECFCTTIAGSWALDTKVAW